jgi:hypothetical protein
MAGNSLTRSPGYLHRRIGTHHGNALTATQAS